jgi:hypothetical protein
MAESVAMEDVMTLRDYIHSMKQGWWLYHPYRAMQIGRRLEAMAIELGLDLGRQVEVEFRMGTHTSGPDTRYWYEWRVSGVVFPATSSAWRLTPSDADRIFGCKERNLPFIEPTDDGFVAGFAW